MKSRVVLCATALVVLLCGATLYGQKKASSSPTTTAKLRKVNINATKGTAKPRHPHANVGDSIGFKADKDCTLKFDNPDIFEGAPPTLDLKKGVRQSLKIAKAGQTQYCVVGAPCPPPARNPHAQSDPNDITVP